jgi:hypothetical protein
MRADAVRRQQLGEAVVVVVLSAVGSAPLSRTWGSSKGVPGGGGAAARGVARGARYALN